MVLRYILKMSFSPGALIKLGNIYSLKYKNAEWWDPQPSCITNDSWKRNYSEGGCWTVPLTLTGKAECPGGWQKSQHTLGVGGVVG